MQDTTSLYGDNNINDYASTKIILKNLLKIQQIFYQQKYYNLAFFKSNVVFFTQFI